MKRFFLLAALCAALLLPCPAHAHELTVAATHWDSGAAAPLPGAAFTLSPAAQSGVTDRAGLLVFSDLPAGAYQLTETDAPAGYLPLEEPVCLLLNHDGTLSLHGHTTRQVTVLHRSGSSMLLWPALFLSTVPMFLRLWWLWRKNK